jgi:elongation factor Ts
MSTNLIKELRAATGAGLLDCKKALAETNNDLDAAADWLRAKGIAAAAKKAGRIATEGMIGTYIHHGSKIGVMVEVNCETDFVALTDDFKSLVHDIAMHIAAEKPRFVSRDEVSAEDAEAERRVQVARAMEEGKPQAVAEKMVEGRMRKWFEEVCLLDQKFIKDDDLTINDLLVNAMARIGENIKVRRFTRYELGEGLAKRQDNFAEEVLAQVNA